MGAIRVAGVASLFLITCLTSGCADEADPKPGPYAPFTWCTIADFQRPEVERVTIDVAATPTVPRPDFGTVLDGTVTDNPTACDCSDDSCTIAWIEENMGCGVCVHLLCGAGQYRAGCVPCPAPADSIASRDNSDASTCVVPVETNPPGWDIQVQPSDTRMSEPSLAPALDPDITRQPR